MYCGTDLYRPPERHKDSCYDLLSGDIWALGLIAYELFGGNVKDFVFSVRNRKEENLKFEINKKIDFKKFQEFRDDFLRCCLDLDPHHRKNPY